MRSFYRLLFLMFSLFLSSDIQAQMVGTNCYLQGRYLEIAMNNNSSFGTCSGIPASYHPHMFGTGIPPAGSNMAEVYDWGRDGWATGTPPYMGDYTYPGSPFEGWELQIGAGRVQAFQNCAGTMTASVGGMTMSGNLTTYTNVGGRATGTWTGTATMGGATLAISQATSIDTNGSAVVVTTVLRNTSAVAAPNVYYMRSCDPDNAQSWGTLGGQFSTINKIVHQNEDARHRVLVKAYDQALTEPKSYMGLGTKDCRARCFIYSSWWLGSTVDLSTVWTGSYGGLGSGFENRLGFCLPTACNPSDIAIGLVYNIGNIAPGDSAIVSYAYIFNGDATGMDDAFPDPQIVVNGTPRPVVPVPYPNYDTFTACQSGLATLPVNIRFADVNNWSWSRWTWAPGTGLASTTGVTNTINLAGLPPIITYTITGTDSASGMSSCLNKVFYLTIISCNGAEANSPCVGDTLWLNAPGDSLGATYKWFGPAPSTAIIGTTQKMFRYPAAITDTGVYSVVKSNGSTSDTSTTHVTIYQLPALNVTTNQVDCSPIVNSLNLFCTPDSVCTSFAWSGPSGYTSTFQNPVINPFDSSKEGIYTVSVISTHGCKKTGTVLVKPGAIVDFNMLAMPGCPRDTAQMIPFGAKNVFQYQWNFGDGGASFDPAPQHLFNASVPGLKVHTVTLTVKSANGCTYVKSGTVDLRHTVTAAYTTMSNPLNIADTVCLGAAINFTDGSNATKFGAANMPLSAFEWKFGDGTTDATANPTHTYLDASVYSATLTVTDNIGCSDSIRKNMVVLNPVIKAMGDSTFCLVRPLLLYNTVSIKPDDVTFPGYGFTYLWSPATDLSSSTEQEPYFSGFGMYTYTMVATLNRHGCIASHVTNLNSILPTQIHHITIDTKILYGNSIQLYCDSEYLYTWTPNDGSLDNPNINNPVATPSVTTTYTVYGMDKYGCRDTAQVTITVDSSANEHVATGFTPNGDGLNDVFRFNGGKHQKLLEMRVYNRWGEEIFYSNNREVGWDGTYKGIPADMGVYYYTIILARPGYPENTVLKGDITLIR